MFCKNCGSQIDNDSRFCPVCGGAVISSGATAGTNNAYQQSANNTNNTYQQPVNNAANNYQQPVSNAANTYRQPVNNTGNSYNLRTSNANGSYQQSYRQPVSNVSRPVTNSNVANGPVPKKGVAFKDRSLGGKIGFILLAWIGILAAAFACILILPWYWKLLSGGYGFVPALITRIVLILSFVGPAIVSFVKGKSK